MNGSPQSLVNIALIVWARQRFADIVELLALQARRLIRLNGSGQKFKPSHRSVVQFDYKLFPTYNIA